MHGFALVPCHFKYTVLSSMPCAKLTDACFLCKQTAVASPEGHTGLAQHTVLPSFTQTHTQALTCMCVAWLVVPACWLGCALLITANVPSETHVNKESVLCVRILLCVLLIRVRFRKGSESNLSGCTGITGIHTLPWARGACPYASC